MLAHAFAQQARQPSGLFGRLFGAGMKRINRGVNDWVISLLEVTPSSRVLEIGFGPGQAVKQIASILDTGMVAGLDMSDTMVNLARKINSTEILSGKADLRKGSAANIPFQDNSFDMVFCVNVIYFWPTPGVELSSMHKACKPGGRVAIYIGDPEEMSKVRITKTGVFNLYSV
jgi:ubiquinone/menaquinone biosynthesis C-methylase UbiE